MVYFTPQLESSLWDQPAQRQPFALSTGWWTTSTNERPLNRKEKIFKSYRIKAMWVPEEQVTYGIPWSKMCEFFLQWTWQLKKNYILALFKSYSKLDAPSGRRTWRAWRSWWAKQNHGLGGIFPTPTTDPWHVRSVNDQALRDGSIGTGIQTECAVELAREKKNRQTSGMLLITCCSALR